jgi:hypothetical protein
MSYYPSPPPIPTRKVQPPPPPSAFPTQQPEDDWFSQQAGTQSQPMSSQQSSGQGYQQGSNYQQTPSLSQPQGYQQRSGYPQPPSFPHHEGGYEQRSGYPQPPSFPQHEGQSSHQRSGYAQPPSFPQQESQGHQQRSGYAQPPSFPQQGAQGFQQSVGYPPSSQQQPGLGYQQQSGQGYQQPAPSNQPVGVPRPVQPVNPPVAPPVVPPVVPSSQSFGSQMAPAGQQAISRSTQQQPFPSAQDWFGQSGFATAIGAAAMTAMAGGNQSAVTQMVAGAFDAEKQKSLSWFQSQTLFLKEYFNVTHAYVRWKLLFILLPFVQTQSQLVSRAVSRDVPHSDTDSDEQTGQGSGVGLRLFPGRKPDLYIPIMGFITFVLVHCLSRWKDFHPDDLYNVASLGILLGLVEVLLVKGVSYVMNVAHWGITDVVAVCGYKFANLSLSLVLLILVGGVGGKPVWLGLYVLAAAMAGLGLHKHLLAVSSYNATRQHYMGTHSPTMERLVALAAGGAQFLWVWILMPSMKVVATVHVVAGAGGVRQVLNT